MSELTAGLPAGVPKKLGPYRVDAVLGAGGMGEVFRGFDDRLDRPVALKRLKPGAALSTAARERFRREARAAARLSHGSIVQVYDWFSAEDVDWIVMEWVDGHPLRDLVAHGPVDPIVAARILQRIAMGLSAAHGAGLIHRDLKPENVMVRADGEVKILDFGLSKLVRQESVSAATSLSSPGQVMGTLAYMAPEQALGRAIDHRADLFALGSVFYEMLTGTTPFAGDTPAAILSRICTTIQVPAVHRSPTVPPSFSRLADRLLEKEPEHRPASADDVVSALDALPVTPSVEAVQGIADVATLDPDASPPKLAAADGASEGQAPAPERVRWWRWRGVGVAAVVGVLALTLWMAWPGRLEPLDVAVLMPHGKVDDSIDAGLVAGALRGAVTSGLLTLEGVSIPPNDEVDVLDGRSVDIARSLQVDEVITTRFDCVKQLCQVGVSRISAETGDTAWGASFPSLAGDLSTLHDAVVQNLLRGYPRRPQRPGAHGPRVRAQDYETYLRLRQLHHERRTESTVDELLDALDQLQVTSPRFLDAYLFEASVAALRFYDTRDTHFFDVALAACDVARKLAPTDPRPLFSLADLAFNAHRLDLAEAAIGDLESMSAGHPTVLALRATLSERRGETARALEQLRRATESSPSWVLLRQLGLMEYRSGQIEAARVHLERALSLAPRHVRLQADLAQIELLGGDPQRAVELYEQLVDRSPEIHTLVNLGIANFLLERYGEAADAFRRAISQAPESPVLLLNLADSDQLLGRHAEATAGYRNVITILDDDPFGSTWQGLTVKAQAHAHLGEVEPAIRAAEAALQLAPNNPQVALEAAMVFSLVGELDAAVAQAERAVAGGVDPRWLDFPWFDRLRARPRFRALAAPPAGPA